MFDWYPQYWRKEENYSHSVYCFRNQFVSSFLCQIAWLILWKGFCEFGGRSRLFTRRWSISSCPFHSWTQMKPVNLLQVGRYKFRVETEQASKSSSWLQSSASIFNSTEVDFHEICRRLAQYCWKMDSLKETLLHFVIAFINRLFDGYSSSNLELHPELFPISQFKTWGQMSTIFVRDKWRPCKHNKEQTPSVLGEFLSLSRK